MVQYFLAVYLLLLCSKFNGIVGNEFGFYIEHDGSDTATDFSNEWIIRVDGNEDSANLLALKNGYENMGEIRGFPNYFLFKKHDHPIANDRSSELHTRSLRDEVRVLWAQQLFSKNRVKRRPDHVDKADFDQSHLRRKRQLDDNEEAAFLELVRRSMLVQSLDYTVPIYDVEDPRGIPPRLLKLWEEEEAKSGQDDELAPNPSSNMFNDEFWDHQWYMQDTRSRSSLPSINLNVLPVFDMGITGKGIRVCVLDDGLEHTHDDLRLNYDPDISYDYNSGSKGDPDPTPKYPSDPNGVPNSHGTRCAGEISMTANNRKCGVGMAYNSKIGGIRMLDGKINDQIEGLSLQHAYDKVDIFTASWGPSDDGKTVEAPGHLAQAALYKGVTKGRKGRGIIYVWAAGNGGMHDDNCNCDGYTSSIYTISIGSASEQGQFPWYGEKCSSTMASTYSSGAYTDQKIATTDTNNTCTVGHTGTSAAAPLAAGIIALALEANPTLTWRDVQHLVVLTSSTKVLEENQGWQVNGAGLKYNSRFGFGVMDAYQFVRTAMNWTLVPEAVSQDFDCLPMTSQNLETNHPIEITFEVPESAQVRFLEHVEVSLSIQYPVRGVLQIALISPSGSISQLLTLRPEDKSDAGFKKWKFMSVHFWGENPWGSWKLYIVDKVSKEALSGTVSKPKLRLYGSKSAPLAMNDLERSPRTRKMETLNRSKKRKEIPIFINDIFKDDDDTNKNGEES
ncbi:neuroendocrine convertase 1-like [Tigriopus californicus]|uniref:neuroendocrine convertase 1-like n=1 Tax=Tigriopus californicus TaxID=6832 RepID=UPI0027D9DD8C|nr:neuroendocrine convertase 1-like [Tigriopus californicus]